MSFESPQCLPPSPWRRFSQASSENGTHICTGVCLPRDRPFVLVKIQQDNCSLWSLCQMAWMFSVTQTLEQALFQHFLRQKLEIAYAIHKPFPFFEALRDNSFITETVYQESLEACWCQVPLSRVVHSVLTKLEKTFSPSLLMTLFSRANLREYPNLMAVFTSFKLVGDTYGKWSITTPTQPKALTNPAKGGSLQTLLPLPAPQPPPTKLHSYVPGVRDARASSPQNAKIPDDCPSTPDPAVPLPRLIQDGRSIGVISDNLTSKSNEEEDSGETFSCPTGTVQAFSGDHQTSQTKDKEDSGKMFHAPPSPIPVTCNTFTSIINEHENLREMPHSPQVTVQESNDPEAAQESTSTPSDKKGKKRKRNIWSTPKKRHQKKKRPPETNNEASEKNDGKRPQKTPGTPPRATREKKRKQYSQSSSTRTQSTQLPREVASPAREIQVKLRRADQGTQRKNDPIWDLKVVTRSQKAKAECVHMSRSKEKSEDDPVDFLSPTLPVTCGEAKGILYKEKMKPECSEKCIQNAAGAWLTPKEFLIEGKRAKSKDWKKSVCCRGKTLRCLQEKGLLFCPSRITSRRR